MSKAQKYQVVETYGTIKRDRLNPRYQYSIKDMDVERLVQDYFDFEPHANQRVKVIIMIGEEE